MNVVSLAMTNATLVSDKGTCMLNLNPQISTFNQKQISNSARDKYEILCNASSHFFLRLSKETAVLNCYPMCLEIASFSIPIITRSSASLRKTRGYSSYVHIRIEFTFDSHKKSYSNIHSQSSF